MPVNDELGKRMKTYYETIPKTRLMRRTPVAIRIDGKAFHTFTRGFGKPFDEILVHTMQHTMKYLCENIQGCVFGYTQSDEITLILIDYQTLTTDAWFDYEVQKMCSIAASMATLAFNRFFERFVNSYYDIEYAMQYPEQCKPEELECIKNYCSAMNKGAMFDARCFNIPKEEVTNLIYWRQLDATRNSIQMVGQANFSHKELQGKSCNMIQDMLMTQKNINWNDFPTRLKRGSCCVKQTTKEDLTIERGFGEPEIRTKVTTKWIIDTEIPIFKGEDRKYIEDLIYVGE
jgi:tRNA(His) 5'-end guanylyltransferase